MKTLCLYFYETSLLIFFSSHNSQNQYFLRDASSISTNYFGFDQKKTLENFRHHVLAGHVKTVENASQTTKKESLHALVNLVLVEKLVKQVSTETIS